MARSCRKRARERPCERAVKKLKMDKMIVRILRAKTNVVDRMNEMPPLSECTKTSPDKFWAGACGGEEFAELVRQALLSDG